MGRTRVLSRAWRRCWVTAIEAKGESERTIGAGGARRAATDIFGRALIPLSPSSESSMINVRRLEGICQNSETLSSLSSDGLGFLSSDDSWSVHSNGSFWPSSSGLFGLTAGPDAGQRRILECLPWWQRVM